METKTMDIKEQFMDLTEDFEKLLGKQINDFENLKSLLKEQNDNNRACINLINTLYNFLMQDRNNRRSSERIAKGFNLIINSFNDNITTNNLVIDDLNNFKNVIEHKKICLNELSKIED